ncbi:MULTISPECIES: RagB/SusD family nutrient uptake outer membrane protein [Sphingobacterium]|uniref:RagB/SusD family nutrient uptake outer membrane protein n=1 Tax=Sphingobacterium TaxID=28453 RepID=UPI00257FE410|nr:MULTISPECIES: RagB/SusD family nutrient uptake outer membrane protein [Sphingobacterium]
MKVITIKIYAVIATLFLASCNRDFLDIQPKDQLTVPSTFTTYENIRTYAWQFYNALPAYDQGVLNSELNSDLMLNSTANSESNWIWNRMVVPASSGDWSDPYKNIRTVNIMLDNLDKSSLSEADKKHWQAVGYFFRSLNYINLLNKYGGVPLVLKELTDQDTEILYGPRNTRDEVSQHILTELLWAEQNIKPEGDGPNTINVHVVRALLSRFGLREGTWRKYHGMQDGEKYLNASVKASESLMLKFPTIHPIYDEVFNSLSLATVQGIILYKSYEDNQVMHTLCYLPRTSSGRWDLTKKMADMYLMRDGQTRWTSPEFDGDKNPYDEFRNRDRRMYFTTPPPYRVQVNHPSFTWTHTGDPKHREYIDLMNQLSDANHKRFPMTNWEGLVLRGMPHFQDFQEGQPFTVSYTGYQFYKFTNWFLFVQGRDITDCPIFRIEEVMLNYAEAKFELGQLNQDIVDRTINLLRKRGAVATLKIDAIPSDPTRDMTVSPLLWEVRRERAVELIGEGFRFDDLRRWKKMDYTSEVKLGRYIAKGTDVPANNAIRIQNGATAGYIDYFGKPPVPFSEYYYLYPIPSDQIVLNPQLVQNPGWSK